MDRYLNVAHPMEEAEMEEVLSIRQGDVTRSVKICWPDLNELQFLKEAIHSPGLRLHAFLDHLYAHPHAP